MKILLPAFLIVFTMAACHQSNKDDARNIQMLSDSTAFTNNNVYSDTMSGVQSDAKEAPEVPANDATAKQTEKTRTIIKYVPVKTEAAKPAARQEETSSVAVPSTKPVVTNPSAGNDSATVLTDKGTADAGIPGAATEKKEKKGWSKAAQGAVIGGAAGAVGGAIISKKKGLGAVIGAAVGAAGGYIIGKNKDKKDTTTTTHKN